MSAAGRGGYGQLFQRLRQVIIVMPEAPSRRLAAERQRWAGRSCHEASELPDSWDEMGIG